MKIVLIHGFNVKDGGAETVDRLEPHLTALGHTIEKDEADYGFFSLWMVRFRKHSAVLRIVNALSSADAVVAHSNGANYAIKALRLILFNKLKVVFLSPALNRKTKIPEAVEHLHVFHTRSDWIVWLSGFLWFHPWGRMGQRGYKGNNPNVTNMDFTDVIKGHSDWFKDESVELIANDIHGLLTEAKP